MRTGMITRCLMLAFLMSFLTVGMAYAGVGGQGVPTYPLEVAVGENNIPAQLVFSNGNTSPFNACSDVVSNVEHTPSCGDANNLLLCDNPDPGVFSVVNADGVSIAATGINANALCTAANSPFTCCTGSATGNCNGCLGSQWTAIIDDVTTGRYKFTPTATVTLAPGAFCVIQFLVDVVKEPTVDSQPLTGTQTDQLVSATYTTTGCTTLNGTPGAGQGSGFVTVEQGCIQVTKSCVSPTSCTNPTITESVTVTNCGSEDLNSVSVTDTNATLTCSGTSLPVGGSPITCSGSYQGTPGSSTTDTVTATGTGAISAATFTATATATCSAPAAPAICVTKACTNASSCANPTISESVTVTNCGCGADLTGVTVTDSLATLTCSGTSLPCGSTTTCTSAASITCSGSYQGTIGASTTDTVTASATGAGQTVTATASATCSVPPASPAICVTKACTNAASCANPTISESVTVTNCGTCADLTGVSVTDSKATLTCNGTSLPCGSNPANCSAGGASITCTGSYQGTIGASTTDTVTASATGAGQTVTATASATCSVPPASPAICVTKACTNASSCANPTINESVTVTNCGTCADLTGVTVTDSKATLTCNGTSLPCGSNPANCSAGGASIKCTGSYQGTPGSSTTDTVTASATGAGQTVTATASATCSAPAAPAICVTKTCTNAASCANPTISESVTVTNCGCGADLAGVTVTDSKATTLTCSGTSLPCGSTTTCTSAASITCTGSYQGTIGASTTDTVTASAAGAGQTVTATASATCNTPSCPCQIQITKAVGPDVDCNGVLDPGGIFGPSITENVGQCVVYQICVTNSCTTSDCQTIDASGVTVSDAHLGIVSFNFGTLTPGQTVCELVPSQITTATACPNGTCICEQVEGTNTAVVSSAVCETTVASACDQTGSICSAIAEVACIRPTACRMTGGHNNSVGSVDATFVGNGKAYTTGGQIGAPSAVGCCDFPQKGKCVNGLCAGGLRGGLNCASNDDCPPNTGSASTCPWGDWEHNHHFGPDDLWVANHSTGISNGSFAFHSGTAASPDAAFIHNIICADPGWCVQARPAPDKQIFWEGTGVFHNTTNGTSKLPVPLPKFLNCPSQPVPWSNKTTGTISYYRAHVGDFGEPAGVNQKQPPVTATCTWNDFCTVSSTDDNAVPIPGTELFGGVSIFDCSLANGSCNFSPAPVDQKFTDLHPLCLAQDCGCAAGGDSSCQTNKVGCPDWYEIEIHCGVAPSVLAQQGDAHAQFEFLKTQPIAYKVAHFITQGNFQLHPEVGRSCNPSCGNGICEPGVPEANTGETCANCPADCGTCP